MLGKNKKILEQKLTQELTLKKATLSFESLFYFSQKEVRNADLIWKVSKILKTLRKHRTGFQESKQKLASDFDVALLGNNYNVDIIKNRNGLLQFQKELSKLEKEIVTIEFSSKIKYSVIKNLMKENSDLKLNMNFVEILDWLIDDK